MSEEITVNFIRLADGTLIDPLTREPIVTRQDKETETDDEEFEDDLQDVLEIVPTARRSVMDLSLSPKQMAFINNVLVYTLWGLPDDEIAIQCNCDIEQIHIVRDLDDYRRMHDALIEGIRNAFMSTVNGIIQDAAPRAARGIIRNLRSKSSDVRLAAQKDVLDRAGHRPADRVDHVHSIESGSELVIRVIKQSESDSLPKLDLTPNA